MAETPPRPAYGQMNAEVAKQFHENGGVISTGFHAGRPILLLHTKGAKSGEPRMHPVNYSRDGDRYVVIASKGGNPQSPSWYHNAMKAGRATIEVGTEKLDVKVTEAKG